MRDIRDMEAEAKRIKDMTPEQRDKHDKQLVQWQHTLSVVDDITTERGRQVDVEGWTPEHDDEHAGGEMAKAAACYAMGKQFFEYVSPGVPREVWPWDYRWWKPKERRRNLVRAAALIVAEIERLDRAALQAQERK